MTKQGRSVWLVGICALFSGAVSAAVVALDGDGHLGGAFTGGQPTIYGPAQAALALAVAVSGFLVVIARKGVAVAALLGMTGLGAAQLAGTGLVGRRRWPLFWGCCSQPVAEQDLVRTLATVMAIVCAITAVACLVVLVRGRYVRWTGLEARVGIAFAAALVVAIAGPPLAVGGWLDVKELAAWALMYSLPFASALAISALMQRSAALATVAAVAGSTLVAAAGDSFLERMQPGTEAHVLAVVAAAVVAATRLSPKLTRTPAEVARPSP